MWLPYRRSSDGEHVGYLVSHDLDPEMVVPMSLIGSPLGIPQTPEAAGSVLAARGLAVLAERWWCRLPKPLPPSPIAVDQPRPEWVWRPVLLVEVRPTGSRIRPEMPAPEEFTRQVALPTPVNGLLRSKSPD